MVRNEIRSRQSARRWEGHADLARGACTTIRAPEVEHHSPATEFVGFVMEITAGIIRIGVCRDGPGDGVMTQRSGRLSTVGQFQAWASIPRAGSLFSVWTGELSVKMRVTLIALMFIFTTASERLRKTLMISSIGFPELLSPAS